VTFRKIGRFGVNIVLAVCYLLNEDTGRDVLKVIPIIHDLTRGFKIEFTFV